MNEKEAKLPRSKCLYKDFVIIRNNAIQRRRFQNEQMYGSTEEDARRRLLPDYEEENGFNIPSYVGQSEALSYSMTRLENKVERLDTLHKRHLGRPTLDEDDVEAREIDEATKDVISLFSTCHGQIKMIQRSVFKKSGLEQTLVSNIVQSLGNRLQESTEQFRTSQSVYLKTIKSREEKSQHYFADFGYEEDSSTTELNRAWTKESVLLVEENDTFIANRENEIQSIVSSIIELNSIFNDLAHIVSEQGTIVDRIDYNIEKTQFKVEDGLKELKTASKYQKKDKKMHCIAILSVIVVILFCILMIKISL